MSALSFLMRGKRDVTVAYFNHNTEHGNDAEGFLESFCSRHGLSYVTARYKHTDLAKKPTEASWREARYEFLASFEIPVVTGHHLQDAVEWWLFTSLRGNPRLTPVVRKDIPVIRPFLLTHPSDLHKQSSLPYIQDESNFSDDYSRNIIRNNILEHAIKVNPGLYTTIKNLYR